MMMMVMMRSLALPLVVKNRCPSQRVRSAARGRYRVVRPRRRGGTIYQVHRPHDDGDCGGLEEGLVKDGCSATPAFD